VDLLLEALVHTVQVCLFDADLSLPHGVLVDFLGGVVNRGFLLSLSGHRAPF
jgi:hypothetical protein